MIQYIIFFACAFFIPQFYEADVTILSFNNLITYDPKSTKQEEEEMNVNNNNKEEEGLNKKSNIVKIDDDNHQNPIKLLPIVGKVNPYFHYVYF